MHDDMQYAVCRVVALSGVRLHRRIRVEKAINQKCLFLIRSKGISHRPIHLKCHAYNHVSKFSRRLASLDITVIRTPAMGVEILCDRG